MPARQRTPSELTQQLVPLLLLGIGLVTSNAAATIVADEARTLSLATQPVRDTLARFFSANHAPYFHPPLFDGLLHFWLRWTGGTFEYLRIPSILFFLAGLFLLARASRELTGTKGSSAVVCVGVLSPFGFHYGRLAITPLFAFFLVCGLTFAYLKYLQHQSWVRWTALFLFSLGLIWTSYLAWAILGCLMIDLLLHSQDNEFLGKLRGLALAIVLLAAAFVPFFTAFRDALRATANVHYGALSTLVNAADCVYALFVSESMAPWYWWFSVPAGLAVLLCLALVVWWTPRPAQRLLLYSGCLIAALALLGTLDMSRLLTLSPWILLPVGIAIEAEKPRWANFSLAAALLALAGIGWYGVYSRRYYSEPRWIEPWQEVAGQAATKIRGGATVIADHPSFLLYLTYALHIPTQNGPWTYQGSVTEFAHHPQIFSSAGWLAAGHPIGAKMILVRAGVGSSPIGDAAKQLDQACGSISSRLMVRDQGYAWKQRFFPQRDEPQWQIEIREYDCGSPNSKEIFRIPPR